MIIIIIYLTIIKMCVNRIFLLLIYILIFIIFLGVGTISNGVLNNVKHIQQNGHIYQNGIANGTTHMLQNGVAHLANGVVSGNNKAPAMHNYLPKDPIKKMYNEIEGYQNLHM